MLTGRFSLVFFVAFLLHPTASLAQTEGRIGVGVAVIRALPTDDGLETSYGVGLQLSRIPREGFGFVGAFNWFGAEVGGAFAGVGGNVARLNVRPLMGGVGYTFRRGRAALSLSAVTGPALTTLSVKEEFRDRVRVDGDSDKHIVSLATRIGAGATFAVRPRLALTGFAGYMFNRPEFTVQTDAGEFTTPWKADSRVISIGVIYSLF
jgi:hypothetical protein